MENCFSEYYPNEIIQFKHVERKIQIHIRITAYNFTCTTLDVIEKRNS